MIEYWCGLTGTGIDHSKYITSTLKNMQAGGSI